MPFYETLEGAIALIEFENPPVNALSIDFVTQLSKKIAHWQQDSRIKALILAGKGRFFSAGANIGEFDGDPVTVINVLQGLNQQLNHCPKLVVMALHGAALGGGCELALSAHARIAAHGTKIGVPEIHLGLLPGAGGTQALPRLVGIQQAYEMMIQGLPLLPEKAHHIGLIDAISNGNLIADALSLTRHLLEKKTLPLKPFERHIPQKQAELINFYRQTVPFHEGARATSAQAILDCLEVAIERPFPEGLKFEAEKFHRLLGSYASRALRYGFFAAKSAASLSEERKTQIGSRMMAALQQEADRLIAEGIARQSQDIDAIMVNAQGFAAESGGPLFWLKEHKNDSE